MTDYMQVEKMLPKKLLLTVLCFAVGCQDMGFSILAPFYPKKAESKGMTQVWIGFIFAIFSISFILFCIWIPNIMDCWGKKQSICIGMVLASATSICFSFVDKLNYTEFLTASIFIRAAQGIGCSLFEVATATYLNAIFSKDELGVAMGFFESSRGAGMLLGPIAGGALYHIGGFSLPFIVNGAILFVQFIVLLCCLPRISIEENKNLPDWGSVLRNPAIVINYITTVLSGAALAFLDPTLGLFLHDTFNFSIFEIGIYFSSAVGFYIIFAPISGWSGEMLGNFRIVKWSQLFLGSAYILLGPIPLGDFLEPNRWLNLIALCLIGISAAGMVCSIPYANNVVRSMGLDPEGSGITSTLLMVSYTLGAVVGAMLGSSLVQQFKFPWASSIFGCLILFWWGFLMIMDLFGIFSVDIPRSDDEGLLDRKSNNSLAINY